MWLSARRSLEVGRSRMKWSGVVRLVGRLDGVRVWGVGGGWGSKAWGWDVGIEKGYELVG